MKSAHRSVHRGESDECRNGRCRAAIEPRSDREKSRNCEDNHRAMDRRRRRPQPEARNDEFAFRLLDIPTRHVDGPLAPP